MLVEDTLFGTKDKVQIAMERLRAFEPNEGYYVAFSGGKDSQVIYHLCKEAGVKMDAHYSLTTVDPPEVIYFIRRQYPDVLFNYPETSMWRLIEKKGLPPTRLIRYCCQAFKENYGQGRLVVTGVRWAESSRRKNKRGLLELNTDTSDNRIILKNDNEETRQMFETCLVKSQHILNPIIDWTEDDVWEYLDRVGVPHCCLYDEGFSRIGCIGCPMAGTKGMLKEFTRYPKYYEAYLRAFERMLQVRRDNGKPYTHWQSAQDVMDWWIYGQSKISVNEDQLSLFDRGDYDSEPD